MKKSTDKQDEIKRLFVIDDDSSIVDILLTMLSAENYDVDTFLTGRNAVEKAKKKKPDMIILDYFLRGETAEDTMEKLRAVAGEDLPVILMSASVQGERLAKQLPISEFIPKPFHRQVLLAAIDRNIK